MAPSPYRERIYAAFADTDLGFEESVARALEIGTAYLGHPIGFLTHIDEGIQEILVATGDHEAIQPGETCPLEEAYCRRTIQEDGTLAVQEAETSAAVSDLAFETFGLQTYIGAKVVVDESVYGTVCFADTEPRERPFSETEELFVELLARLVGQALERRTHERELRLKDRAMDEARVGVSIADNREPDRPLVYVNTEFERITGYDAQEVLGRNCRLLQGPATDEATVARLRRAIDGEEPVAVELVNYRRDGTPFWNQLRINPVEDEHGTVTHFLGFQEDITERKRMEQLVRLLNRVLRHNMRNDLNVLAGVGDLLSGGAEDSTALGERVRDTANDLVELAEEARVLERIARSERDPGRVDPEETLATIAETYREEYPDGAVSLSVATDRCFCAGPELKRAFTELVENALEHGGPGPTDVTVAVTDDGDWLELTVTDDGPGIVDMEAAVISKGKERALEHGSGLGLWLVNWIVTRYGGSFQIQSQPGGEGTRATVRLPAIDADTPVDAVARRPTVLFQ